MTRFLEWCKRILADRRLPWVAALAAIALCLGALGTGFQLDDHYQRVVLERVAGAPGDVDELFAVISEPADVERFRQMGAVPWWTAPDLELSFFRPLAIATHWLDYRLWPERPALMHAHSLAWLGALIVAVSRLYRAIAGLAHPAWVAGLATLFYALDDAHGNPAGWLAGRNALVAATFGVLALLAHDRWRREGWRPGALLAPVALLAALLSAEFGVGAMAYLLAYALALERGGWRRRALSLLPATVVCSGWLAFYKLAGYGARSSSFYVDPLTDPARYLAALFERAPVLLLGQWLFPPADAYTVLPPERSGAVWWLAVGVVVALAVTLAPLLTRSATARFWALGMVAAIAPIVATAPSNRLLLLVGVGAMGLAAELVSCYSRLGRRFFRLAIPGGLILVHLLLAVLLLPGAAVSHAWMGTPARVAVLSLPEGDRLSDRDLVVVNAPDFLFFVAAIWPIRALEGLPVPRRIASLVPVPVAFDLTRTDERTLEARFEDDFFSGALGGLFVALDGPPAEGEVRAGPMEVEILERDARQRPVAARFRFDLPLEAESYLWVAWSENRFEPFRLPNVGETIALPAARGPLEMTDPKEMIENYRRARSWLDGSAAKGG